MHLLLRPMACLLIGYGALTITGLTHTNAAQPARNPEAGDNRSALTSLNGRRSLWAILESLDLKSKRGSARSEDKGEAFGFSFTPRTLFMRFGEPGAMPDEFLQGARVHLNLQKVGKTNEWQLVEIRDEISDQVQKNSLFRLVSLDREKYQAHFEQIDRAGNRLNEGRFTLGYGKGTKFIQRESPVYSFRPSPGSMLWLNSGIDPNKERMVREVVDEPSLKRLQNQQRLRLIARCDVTGAAAQIETGSKGWRLQLFPDVGAWSGSLKPGDMLQLHHGTAGNMMVQIRDLSKIRENTVLNIGGSLPAGVKPGDEIAVKRGDASVSYSRDIRPFLEVNCGACHHDGGAQSGFSISKERLFAGGRRGVGIVPRKSSESLVYLLMSGDRNPRMPPDRDPSPEQLIKLRSWIDAGADLEK